MGGNRNHNVFLHISNLKHLSRCPQHAGIVVCAESEPEPRSDNYSEQQKTDVNGKVATAGQASETGDES